ncbi:MAG: asparagine synthase (glutamine-hydrolyzing), partial [Bacteroidota bacterium]
MCGINGIFGLEKISDPVSVIGKMNAALAHRGPDADGYFVSGNIAFGHRRLSIIDLSDAGNQPFHSPDKRYTIIFNGEIYNYRELKNELKEFQFQTGTDTEVLLFAFIKWGEKCLAKLSGMYAFAIWDNQSSELFIARDRMGVKPLYYYQNDRSFIFSSEIRALLSSGIVPPETDSDALVDYFRYQTVHAPRTILKNVFMLMPGHFAWINDNEVKIRKYWNAADNYNEFSENQSYEACVKNVKELLLSSVEKRLVADVPFGAFLSGGIDSSAVVALMSEVSSQRVNTFTVTFAEEEFSEAKYARIIAEKYKTRHTEIKLTPSDFLQMIPGALASMDHPSGDGPNTWVVSKVTKEAGITMALSGIGGDELFAGYDVFKRLYGLKSKEWLQYFPMPVRKMGSSVLKTFRPGVSSDKLDTFLRLEYFDIENVYPVMRQVLTEKKIAALLNKKKLPLRSVHEMMLDGVGTGKHGYNLPELSKISYGEIYSYLQNVLLRDTDQMSMAHALEVREPFLDHQLVEYVMGIKSSFKFPHTPKKLLVDAMGDLLPSEIVNRPKMGFTLPWKEWMKNELRGFCEEKINQLSQREFINE